MTVPFAELKRCYGAHRGEFDGAYHDVMSRGHYIMGPELEAFEKEFAAYCGAKYALGVGDGLDALVLILRALGIGAGDEVIVSAHTFIASWLAITQVGAKVIPVPPRENGFLLDEKAVEKLITPATKAVMPVHLYGEPVNMTALAAVAAKHVLPIVEDAAQAHGATHGGTSCGNFGMAAGFSFYPGKNLGAFGDGGAITTSDDALYEKLKRLRNYGSRVKYVHEVAGYNSRLDEMQAAFLRVKLRHLETWNEKRRQTAKRYNEAFHGLNFLQPPSAAQGDVAVWHQYVITTPHRDALQAHLKAQGVETLIHYPIANHKQGAYADEDFSRFNLGGYEKLVQSILSLPIDAFMTEKETDDVINAIRSFQP